MNNSLVNCKTCKIEFLKNKHEIKRTKNNFCSNDCCINYNKKILLPISKQNRIVNYNNNPNRCKNCFSNLEYSKKNNKYCSRRCAAFDTQKNGGHKKWSIEEKKKLSLLAKKQIRIKNHKSIMCPNCNFIFFKNKKSTQIYCSLQCRNVYIKKNGLLKGKCGGYRERGGRGKQGWYKGYFCNSSWELAWVIYNLDHNIKFKRNTKGFLYTFNGNQYKFYPDFIKENTNEYIEIKGYIDYKNKAKISSFPHKLNLIDKKSIKFYIDYVVNKYGKNFIDLYEN